MDRGGGGEQREKSPAIQPCVVAYRNHREGPCHSRSGLRGMARVGRGGKWDRRHTERRELHLVVKGCRDGKMRSQESAGMENGEARTRQPLPLTPESRFTGPSHPSQIGPRGSLLPERPGMIALHSSDLNPGGPQLPRCTPQYPRALQQTHRDTMEGNTAPEV